MAVGSQFKKYLESNYKNLDVSLDEVHVDSPPQDDSHVTRMELEELERIIQESKLPDTLINIADKEPLHLFYSVAKKKGLDPLEDEARDWAEDWTKLSFEYKMKFKRRRPWEVKKEHDIDFVVNKSDTTESPSYPSGHAMMGYGVAEFYKDKYPLMADKWDNIADIIAHSRLQMGVHYPSDVEASKHIVSSLNHKVKEAFSLSDMLKRTRQKITSNKQLLRNIPKYKKVLEELYNYSDEQYERLGDLLKHSSYIDKRAEESPTISNMDWAKEEHDNTKIPRWFKEDTMRSSIADELGFDDKTAPTFHKNEDASLNGSNAYYNPANHEIHYDTGEWTPGVLAHEIGHSTMEISPLAKGFNIGKDALSIASLPLSIAAASSSIDKSAPTLLEGLLTSGGISNKLEALYDGLKGRGTRWGAGALALASLGTLAEEARASYHGRKGIDRLVKDNVLSEEQGDMAKDTMSGAFNTYLAAAPIGLFSDYAVK